MPVSAQLRVLSLTPTLCNKNEMTSAELGCVLINWIGSLNFTVNANNPLGKLPSFLSEEMGIKWANGEKPALRQGGRSVDSNALSPCPWCSEGSENKSPYSLYHISIPQADTEQGPWALSKSYSKCPSVLSSRELTTTMSDLDCKQFVAYSLYSQGVLLTIHI